MDDKELNKLRNLQAPEINEKDKEIAINLAKKALREENLQGISIWSRLTHRFNQNLWSNIMKKQLIAATGITGVIALGLFLKLDVDFDQTSISEPPSATKHSQELATPKLEQIVNDDIADTNVTTTQEPVGGAQTKFAEKKSNNRELVKSKEFEARSPGFVPQRSWARPESSSGSKRRNNSAAFLSDSLVASNIDIVVPIENRDKFQKYESGKINITSESPVSTFSVDVDTASYSLVRRSINQGALPNKDSVRVEELINYFNYSYPTPANKDVPFKTTMELLKTPWNKDTKLLKVGIKGYDLDRSEKPKANLVFLIDVSGSMSSTDKLPLLKSAFKMMVNNLNDTDRVAIVTYAGRAGTVLEPTPVKNKQKIIQALNNLESGGSTAGAQGIRQAYSLASENYNEDGVNRVILATDGDFNVGMSSNNELKTFIEKQRESGITLSILGFGRGNYNDSLMQTLAQNGNGNASYIDTLSEAQKVLVDEAGSNLFTIAKDVKLQVEFNPAVISEYRLIGYETRALAREDFNNDKVDAGDIGAGHTVTALYEITPVGSKAQSVDNLRYAKKVAAPQDSDELGFLKVRYKLPNGKKSKLLETAITKNMEKSEVGADTRFAVSVAAFGQLLRGSKYVGDYSFDDVLELAKSAKDQDEFGYRAEFIKLVSLAKSLS